MTGNLTYPYHPFVCVRWGAFGSIANVKEPTLEEIRSMVVLNEDFKLANIIGWQVESDIITDPNWGVHLHQRNGHLQTGEARLVFFSALAGLDIRKMLWRGKRGYVAILPSGCQRLDAPMNIYPVRVAHVVTLQDLEQGGAKVDVRFSVTATPATDVFIPEVVAP